MLVLERTVVLTVLNFSFKNNFTKEVVDIYINLLNKIYENFLFLLTKINIYEKNLSEVIIFYPVNFNILF